MATQAERRAATRAKLITTARDHFAQNGYGETHTNSILKETGLSRGAMYHHFTDKRALFEAVFIAVSKEAIDHAVQHGKKEGSPIETLIAACTAWLQIARRPDIAPILLDQGLQVLGWERARELEEASSLSLMKRSLEKAVATNEITVPSIDLTARLLNALLAEAALTEFHNKTDISKKDQEDLVCQFIKGLRPAI